MWHLFHNSLKEVHSVHATLVQYIHKQEWNINQQLKQPFD